MKVKRLIIGLVATLLLSVVWTQTAQASTATTYPTPVTTAPVGSGLPWIAPPGTTVSGNLAQSQHGYKDAVADAKATSTAPKGAAYVNWYWGSVLLTLQHNDLVSAWYQGAFWGTVALVGFVCTRIPNPWIAAACGIYVAFEAAFIQQSMANAYNTVTWMGNFYCDVENAPVCPGSYDANAGVWQLFGHNWMFPSQNAGLNLLFSWGGNLIAVQTNPYSG